MTAGYAAGKKEKIYGIEFTIPYAILLTWSMCSCKTIVQLNLDYSASSFLLFQQMYCFISNKEH